MRIMGIGIGVLIVGFGVALIREFGRYVEEINPYAPEDYPKNDEGNDF